MKVDKCKKNLPGGRVTLSAMVICLGLLLTEAPVSGGEGAVLGVTSAGFWFSRNASSQEVEKIKRQLADLEGKYQEAEKEFNQAKEAFDKSASQDRGKAVKTLVECRRKRDALAQEVMDLKSKLQQAEKKVAQDSCCTTPVPSGPATVTPPQAVSTGSEASVQKPQSVPAVSVPTTTTKEPQAEVPTKPATAPATVVKAQPVAAKAFATKEPQAEVPTKPATAPATVVKAQPVAAKASAPKRKMEGAESPAMSFQRSGTPQYPIRAIVIIGDRNEVYALRGWQELEQGLVGSSLSEEDLTAIQKLILTKLQADGYVFSKISLDRPALGVGFLAFNVEVGEIGDISIVGNRHYRAEQVIKNIDARTGEGFNYRELYQNIFSLNVKPDVTVDTKLKPHDEADGRRVIDMDMAVRDRLPIHGAVNLSNTGSKDTGDWRLKTTLQHLNLSRHDDILTLQWLTDPKNIDEVNALASSYFLPFGDVWSLTVYGGYSESDIDGLFTDFDVRGEGHFAGLRFSRILTQNARRSVDLALGYTYQYVDNSTDFAGTAFDKKTTQLGTPYLTLGYADKVFDRFGGRNFASGTLLLNWEDELGSYDEDDFRRNYPLADASFAITRLQAARLQKLYSGEDAPGKWTLMAKASAQLTGDSLVPAVKTYVGGADSVRGYREDEFNGDESIVVQLELRTPLFTNFIPGLERDEEFLRRNPDAWTQHRLQFITFFDYGTLKSNDPLPGLQTHEDLMGVGAGLRMSLTKYFQLKFDYGVPLEDTEDSSHSGRGHISLQMQF